MVHRIGIWTTACCAWLFLAAAAEAENWSGWRGPRGDGTSLEENLPVTWSATENIAWKVEVPGLGHSSPVIWEDKIFLTTCMTDTQQRVLLCLDRKNGEILWKRTVITCPLEVKHNLNSHASGTPATDGKYVYVAFLEIDGSTELATRNVGQVRPLTPGNIVMAAYDFDGNQQWITRVGSFKSVHGFSSSPVLYKNLVIINGDHDGDSYIAAVDKTNGQTVWKVDREHRTRSYVTPIIREIDGRTQMILAGSHAVDSYDPATGERHWHIDGPTEQFVASMVYNGQYLFLTCGFPEKHMMAIRPDGKGNVTETHIAWRTREGASYVPSPVACGDYFVVVSDNGIGSCFEAATGKRMWMKRMGRRYNTSLLTAAGLVYFLDDDGNTKVVKPGPKYEEVAENALNEPCAASPAASNGQIFIRTEKHLYCIGQK